ncbi:hypothetical protein [Nocardioides sp. J54]|uniref:hypothetical protein n=1 Tax=Nocardioides sp. J54 TaxID=935866 RepID=UPI0012FCAFDD|nr:hypothetical protein [Nocardioides sp. J54]
MRPLLVGAVMALVGCVLLPITAFVLDGTRTGEDLVLPVHVLLAAAIGAVLGSLALDPAWAPRRRALTGAGLGLLGAVVGLVLFFLLLNGFDGA